MPSTVDSMNWVFPMEITNTFSQNTLEYKNKTWNVMKQRDFILLSFNLSTKKKENQQNYAFSIGTKIDCIKSSTEKKLSFEILLMTVWKYSSIKNITFYNKLLQNFMNVTEKCNKYLRRICTSKYLNCNLVITIINMNFVAKLFQLEWK